MTTATQFRLAQGTEPLYGQFDLQGFRNTAYRILLGRKLAERLGRRLTRAQLQLIAIGDALSEIITAEYGEDAEGDPVGDLLLKESPVLRTSHQLRLGGNGQ